MQQFIIDRFEGELAVLEREAGGTFDVLKSELPSCKEGDVLVYDNGIYIVDEEETKRRKEIISEKIRKLFEKG